MCWKLVTPSQKIIITIHLEEAKHLLYNNLSVDNTEMNWDVLGFLFCIFHVDEFEIK